MRKLPLALLLLASCIPLDGSTGPAGEDGPPGVDGERGGDGKQGPAGASWPEDKADVYVVTVDAASGEASATARCLERHHLLMTGGCESAGPIWAAVPVDAVDEDAAAGFRCDGDGVRATAVCFGL